MRTIDMDWKLIFNKHFTNKHTNFMKNFFRLVLLSAVALTAGFAVSCTEPNPGDDHYQGTPTISVTPASVTVPLAGGTTEAVTVTTPAEWVLSIDTEGVEASTTSGFGDATVTFEVPAADAMRTIKVTFTATGYVSGFPITKKASISISQTDTEVPSVDGPFVYSDNCGSAVSKVDGYWPYVDAYTGWAPTGGEGYDQSGVTYTGKNASVRNSGKTWAPVGATYATDAPYAYLQAKSDSEFVINNINIKNGVKNYTFSFTAFNQYASLIASPYTPVTTPLESGKNLTISVSADGQNWGTVAFTTMADGNWTYAIAPFTLPADASKLYVKFSGYTADTTTALPDATYQYQAALRFDDFRLVEGGEGPVVDLTIQGGGSDNPGSGTMPENISTIAEILALGDGATIPATAIEAIVISSMELNNLTSKKGMYVQDATGGLQFYLAANHEFAYGTKVQIDLTGATLGSYNGAVQISGLALDKVVAVSTGNTVEAKTVTMADFLANKYEGQYVALEGVQVMADDMSKTWVVGGAHTSLNFEDAAGNTFVVFSSKYSTYGAQTVAQGSGTIKGISSINNGVIQILFTQTSDFAGLTGERFDGIAPNPTPDPEPTPTPSEGEYTSDAPFVCSADDSTNAVYTLGTTTIASQAATGFKLGKSKQQGKFTSTAVGVAGNKTLNFYAVAWNGTTASLYVRVDGGAAQSVALKSNSGATGNPPFTALTLAESDHYSIQLEGLTETSTIEFSTNADFALTTHSGSSPDIAPRAIVCGIKLTDGTTGGDQPGGETPTPDPDPTPEPEPTPDPTPGEYTTVAEFLAAPVDATTLYTLKGTITRVANTTYGNFDLTDDTGTVYIYGLNSPDGATNKYWATSGAKLGDDIVIKTVRAEYNGSPQGSNAHFVEVITPGTRAFWSFAKDALVFGAAGGSQTIAVDAYNLTSEISVASSNSHFTASYANGSLTIAAGENTTADSISGNITVTSGTLEKVITVSQSGVSVGGGTETVAEVVMSTLGYENAAVVSEIKVDDNVTLKFAKATANNDPAYYTTGEAIRLYQNGATMNVAAGGKTIKSIEIQFASNHYYIAPNCGEFSAEGATRVWTGEATEVLFTTTGTDKDHRAYISAVKVTYLQ